MGHPAAPMWVPMGHPTSPLLLLLLLQPLAVPWGCDALGSVPAPCSCSPHNCTVSPCHCLTAHGHILNVTDFHARECGGSVGLVAKVAGAAGGVAVLLAVTAVVCYRRRKAASAGVGWGKQEPPAALGQPHYISRGDEVGGSDAGTAPEYENVFVSRRAGQGWTPRWQEERYRSQVPADDDYFLEGESVPGDQPIYANTQRAPEDIYIVPDHC
ncbi:uncharacterized protein LOC135999201 [Caloenas nicobarica]|uniref:uncharacterized protein LOC135999201 n=1 Tax=Caloenas nicobarica TaxID=187106 RepID=UPI0032B85F7B